MGRPRASVCVKLRFTMRAPHHCRQGGTGAARRHGSAAPRGRGGRPRPTASSAARPGPARAPPPPSAGILNLGRLGGGGGAGGRAAGCRVGCPPRSHSAPSPPPWSRSAPSHRPPPSTAPAGGGEWGASAGAGCAAGLGCAAGPPGGVHGLPATHLDAPAEQRVVHSAQSLAAEWAGDSGRGLLGRRGERRGTAGCADSGEGRRRSAGRGAAPTRGLMRGAASQQALPGPHNPRPDRDLRCSARREGQARRSGRRRAGTQAAGCLPRCSAPGAALPGPIPTRAADWPPLPAFAPLGRSLCRSAGCGPPPPGPHPDGLLLPSAALSSPCAMLACAWLTARTKSNAPKHGNLHCTASARTRSPRGSALHFLSPRCRRGQLGIHIDAAPLALAAALLLGVAVLALASSGCRHQAREGGAREAALRLPPPPPACNQGDAI